LSRVRFVDFNSRIAPMLAAEIERVAHDLAEL
jgi:hypothetical protein